MITIQSLVTDCLTLDVPILLVDTCSILDILRIHTRTENEEKAKRCLLAILDLIEATPIRLKLFAPFQVKNELDANTANVVNSSLREAENIKQKFVVLSNVLGILDSEYELPQPSDPTKVQELLKTLMDDCVDKLAVIESDDACSKRALARAVSDTPPATQGGTAKDCLVLEHCLEVSRQLRSGGFSKKIVFLSSNTRDYCEGSTLALKKPICSEFIELNVVFVNTWEWARRELEI